MTVFSSRHLDVRDGPAARSTLLGLELPRLSIFVSALIVLVYIYLGGLTSAIYNEVLQFFLIVLGFLPLVLLGLKTSAAGRGCRRGSPRCDRPGLRAGSLHANRGSSWAAPRPTRWAWSGSAW